MVTASRGPGSLGPRLSDGCGRIRLHRLAATVLVVLAVLQFAPRRVIAQGPEFQVIVHASNPVTELSAREISRLFLKKLPQWDHGLKVTPIDQEVGSAVRESFSQAIHRRGASAIRNFWQQEIYSGRGVPPPQRASDDEVMRFVRENPGAVGYVSARIPVNGEKTLRIIE